MISSLYQSTYCRSLWLPAYLTITLCIADNHLIVELFIFICTYIHYTGTILAVDEGLNVLADGHRRISRVDKSDEFAINRYFYFVGVGRWIRFQGCSRISSKGRERAYHGSTSCAYNVDVDNDGPSLFSSLAVRAVAGRISHYLNGIYLMTYFRSTCDSTGVPLSGWIGYGGRGSCSQAHYRRKWPQTRLIA